MKKRQDGSAMVMVMCVMVVIMALSLALLLSASVMIMNANRANQKEQCRLAAVSVSETLKDEILAKGKYGTHPEGEGSTGTLIGKLHTVFTSAWIQYDSDADTIKQILIDERGIFNYEMENEAMPSTKTAVQMYWMHPDGEDRSTDEDPLEWADKFEEISLYIRVTCTVGEESGTIISTFKPEITEKDNSVNDFSWKWTFDRNVWEGGDNS